MVRKDKTFDNVFGTLKIKMSAEEINEIINEGEDLD